MVGAYDPQSEKRGLPAVQLYDMQADVGEQKNLQAEQPELAAAHEVADEASGRGPQHPRPCPEERRARGFVEAARVSTEVGSAEQFLPPECVSQDE